MGLLAVKNKFFTGFRIRAFIGAYFRGPLWAPPGFWPFLAGRGSHWPTAPGFLVESRFLRLVGQLDFLGASEAPGMHFSTEKCIPRGSGAQKWPKMVIFGHFWSFYGQKLAIKMANWLFLQLVGQIGLLAVKMG